MSRVLSSVLLVFFVVLTSSCVNSGGKAVGTSVGGDVLRVGISANAPPIAFKKGGKLQGLEVDFAQQLARHLEKQIKFVELAWNKQISSLEEGKIDIIMSGMTITPKRAYRVAFSKPYLRTGQILLVKSEKANHFSSGIYSVMNSKYTVATVRNTTGDLFVTKNIHGIDVARYDKSEKAVKALISGKVDVVIHDAPVLCYYAATSDKANLTPILQFATEEYLAWAVNKTDTTLLADINQFIDEAGADKRMQATVKRWLPQL